MPQVFLLTGTTSFADPGTWDPANNKVECVGSGGYGSLSWAGALAAVSEDVAEPRGIPRNVGAGGGGGAYAVGTNLAATFPVTVAIQPQGISSGGNDTFTYWNANANAAGNVRAACGNSGLGQNGGGQAGSTVYPSGYSGGGGYISFGNATGGNGGGGAGGITGAGGSGNGPSGPGAATGGYGGGVWLSGSTSPGTAGSSGTHFDATHGLGSGGGGGNYPGNGGAGGSYGGGGGSASGDSTATRGLGGNGLMVITWVAYIPVAQIVVVV